MKFIKYNANPKGWKTGDCVIRAVAAATQQSWDTVYEDLSKLGGKKCRMPNDPLVYSSYLKDKGFQEMKQMKHPNGKRYTIGDIVEKYPFSIVVMNCANHLTVAIAGHIIDLWNTEYKTGGKYWLKELNDEELGEMYNYIEWVKENRIVERIRL